MHMFSISSSFSSVMIYHNYREHLESAPAGLINHFTLFCSLHSTGSLRYYVPLQTGLLWLCHIFILLCAIKYPFRVRRLLDNEKHSRSLHIVVVLATSIFPAITLGCTFAFGDYITQLPPGYCVVDDPETTYYLLILPLSIVCGAGITGFILILWLLVKRRRARSVSIHIEL